MSHVKRIQASLLDLQQQQREFQRRHESLAFQAQLDPAAAEEARGVLVELDELDRRIRTAQAAQAHAQRLDAAAAEEERRQAFEATISPAHAAVDTAVTAGRRLKLAIDELLEATAAVTDAESEVRRQLRAAIQASEGLAQQQRALFTSRQLVLLPPDLVAGFVDPGKRSQLQDELKEFSYMETRATRVHAAIDELTFQGGVK